MLPKVGELASNVKGNGSKRLNCFNDQLARIDNIVLDQLYRAGKKVDRVKRKMMETKRDKVVIDPKRMSIFALPKSV